MPNCVAGLGYNTKKKTLANGDEKQIQRKVLCMYQTEEDVSQFTTG